MTHRVVIFVTGWWWILPSLVWPGEPPSDLRCLIKPYAVVAVAAPVEGLIEQMLVDRGDVVAEGQVLARLESSREQAKVAVAQAKADMKAQLMTTEVRTEFTARKAARARDLRKTAAIGQHELDEAETEERLAKVAYLEAQENQRLAQLELEQARTELALRTIRSPISGIVVERLLSPGELARQFPIVTLMQVDPLRVNVFMPSSWFDRVQPGMAVLVIPAMPNRTVYEARVGAVNQIIDSATDTFTVHLEMPNADQRIPAGLGCVVQFASQ